MPTTNYRCGVCGQTSAHPSDDPTPVCNVTAACGLLFTWEQVPARPRISERDVRLVLIGERGDYAYGDPTAYEVIVRGRTAGVVERTERPHATRPGTFVSCWDAEVDGRSGQGDTRKAAVLAALS